MELKALDAIKAYSGAASRVGAAGVAAGDGGIGSFAELVNQTAGGAVDATAKSENMTAQALTKQAELIDVVSAVNGAEMALETVVAIRDRVINAYNEIMRMPI